MNLKSVNYAIFESYNGSDTKATQRIGRLHRLSSDEVAIIYFITIKDTQSEQWKDSMLRGYDLSNIEVISSNKILT